jgi:hypothetical protein
MIMPPLQILKESIIILYMIQQKLHTAYNTTSIGWYRIAPSLLALVTTYTIMSQFLFLLSRQIQYLTE